MLKNLSAKENTSILLQTTAARLTNKDNSKSVKVRVLFSSGSQESCVTRLWITDYGLFRITKNYIRKH